MAANAPAGAPRTPAPPQRLVRWAWGTLVGLLLESGLGVGLNVYSLSPSSPTFAKVFVSIPLLTAHIVLGFLLLVASGVFLLQARKSGVAGVPWRAALVVLFVLLAIQEGFSYTFTQNNAFSAGMVVGFLGAAVFQGMVVYQLRRAGPPTTGPQAPAGSP